MENKFFRLKKIKAQVKQFAPVLFLVIALGLVGIGVSQNPFLVRTKSAMAEAFVPIVSVLSTPIHWVKDISAEASELLHVYAENKRLREENDKLMTWKNVAVKIADDKKQLEDLLNYVPTKEVSYLTARIIADNGGTFARSVIMQAGTQNGVRKGSVAMVPEGVLGRVVETGEDVSRLLLVTDYTSRIPVMVGEQRILCILAGDNTDTPKLVSLPEGAKVAVGDRVVTSGHAGVFPSGLGIGTVASVQNGEIVVTPFTAETNREFVRLVDFGLAGVLLDEPACTCPKAEEND